MAWPEMVEAARSGHAVAVARFAPDRTPMISAAVRLADGNALPIAPVGDAPTAPKRIDNAAPGVDVKAEVERITGKPYDPTKIKRV